MKTGLKRRLALLMVFVLMISLAAGCGSSSKEKGQDTPATSTTTGTEATAETTGEDLPWIEFTVLPLGQQEYELMTREVPNDVVTPYIEEKFHIRLKEIYPRVSGQTLQQILTQYIAANNLPDIVCMPSEEPYWVSTGKFADLTDYIKKMPHYLEYYPEKFWPRSNIDGRQYSIQSIAHKFPITQYESDPYYSGSGGHCIWIREDILAMCGYKFTPSAELEEKFTSQGKKPTLEDVKIEPEIKTPEDFYQLLKKIKDLNIEVGGQPLIPMSIMGWSQFHLGNIFDFGHWRIDENGEVDGWFALPGAKEYYKFLNKLYNEGLIDPDFIIQKPEQLQEKVASGRVAVGIQLNDINAAQQALLQINPEARIRYFPWPKKEPGKGFFDVRVPEGFYRMMISKDFEGIERFTQYVDWLYSEEGQDLIAWGPESAGLWEIRNGVKVFKDEQVKNDVLNNVRNGKGRDYYGLAWPGGTVISFSPIVAVVPRVMPMFKGPERSYPPKLDLLPVMRSLCGVGGLNFDLSASYGDNTELTEAVSNYFWVEFAENKVAKILRAKTDSEFEAAWEEIYNEFLEVTKYEEARKAMETWFEKFPPMK